jgi:hypothetical protein
LGKQVIKNESETDSKLCCDDRLGSGASKLQKGIGNIDYTNVFNPSRKDARLTNQPFEVRGDVKAAKWIFQI